MYEELVANMLDWKIVISVFDWKWRNYIHFQTKTFVKGVHSIILAAMSKNSLNVLLKVDL